MLRFSLALAVLCTGLFSSPADAQIIRKSVSAVRNAGQCIGGNCQAQSTGFFVVGQRDSLGDVITSVGPVVDPVPSMAPALPVPASGPVATAPPMERSVSSRVTRQQFHRALLEARNEGSITLPQFALLYGSSFNPSKMATIEATLNASADAGEMQAGKVDWVALIKLLLPILLQILDGL